MESTKWQKDHELKIIDQFKSPERELTMLDLHRMTRMPIGLLSAALERMCYAGRLMRRSGAKTMAGTYHSLYRLNPPQPPPC